MIKKKFNIIDLFAGCGGLMEGFEESGSYNVLACVEWEKAPCLNLINHMGKKWGYKDASTRVLRFDIQRAKELFAGWQNDPVYGSSNGLDVLADGKVDLIIGGPPCQAYSIAGRIRDKNGMKTDYRNYLFESYLKVVKHYQPEAFIFENVPGLLSAKPGDIPIVNLIKKGFSEAGYEVLDDFKNAVVDFSEYGIPQNRKRIIILGLNKKKYGKEATNLLNKFYFSILTKNKSKKRETVKDAIGDLPCLFPLSNPNRNGRQSHASSNIPNHIPRWHNQRDIKIFKILAEDIKTDTNKYVSTAALKKLYTDTTGKISNIHKYHVLRLDQPSNTIPAHLYKDGLRHIHPDPEQARTITVREAARLQTFPDDYIFVCNQTEQFKMIGNAVPPKFSLILAKSLLEIL